MSERVTVKALLLFGEQAEMVADVPPTAARMTGCSAGSDPWAAVAADTAALRAERHG
jgi:citrate synthase